MQFTYEREGNDYWFTVKLTFTKEVILINQQWTGYHSDEHSEVLKSSELLSFLDNNNLTIQNFSGLEDYLKENYPEVLPTQQPTERELISQLVEMLDHFIEGDDNINFNAYKKAKLYLDPNYDESEDFFV